MSHLSSTQVTPKIHPSKTRDIAMQTYITLMSSICVTYVG